MGIHTNQDGVTRRYGARPVEGQLSRRLPHYGSIQDLQFDFNFEQLPDFDEDASGGSTPDSFSNLQANIPAGSWLKEAYVIVKTAFADAGVPALTIGTYQQDGTVIDADGIFASLDPSAVWTAGVVDIAAGAQVGAAAVVSTTLDAYVKSTLTGGSGLTAGEARLVVRYVQGS